MSTTLLAEDLHLVLSRTPRDVCRLLRKTPGLLMGGGFIRSIITGEQVNDIDLFGPSKDMLEATAKSFAAERAARLHSTDNAYTVLTVGRHPVQFIHRWTYAKPEQLLVDFDFTIAQAVVWWEGASEKQGEWCSLISDHYYPDLASRRLRYLSPNRQEDAGGSLMRVRKFLRRGYHIEAPSLARVVARLVNGIEEVRNHIEEPWLGRVLAGLLREVDPLTIIDGLELADDQHPTGDLGAPERP